MRASPQAINEKSDRLLALQDNVERNPQAIARLKTIWSLVAAGPYPALCPPLITNQDLAPAGLDAFALVETDPALSKPSHRPLKRAILARHGETIELASVG